MMLVVIIVGDSGCRMW